MKTTISSKGRITLPASLRKRDRIEPGQTFTFEPICPGEYWLRRGLPAANEGVVYWLLACP